MKSRSNSTLSLNGWLHICSQCVHAELRQGGCWCWGRQPVALQLSQWEWSLPYAPTDEHPRPVASAGRKVELHSDGRQERQKFILFIIFSCSGGRSKTTPWGVSMCSSLIYVLNSRGRRRRRRGTELDLGGVHLLSAEVRFAVISVSVSGLWGGGGGPWSNWRRRCSRCPLGTGSETCCSGTGRPTTGKDAATCAVYARRTESVAHLCATRASHHLV